MAVRAAADKILRVFGGREHFFPSVRRVRFEGPSGTSAATPFEIRLRPPYVTIATICGHDRASIPQPLKTGAPSFSRNSPSLIAFD